MIRHYALMALRTLARHRLYAAINLFGLAVGLAAALLILIYVRHETSYERHFTQADRIYRLAQDPRDESQSDGIRHHLASQPMADMIRGVGASLGIEAVSRVENGNLILSEGGPPLSQSVGIVDPEFLRIFDFEFIAGDPRSALATPDSLVLSEAAARKFFGSREAVGRMLTAQTGAVLRVTAVIAEPRGPSQVWFEALMSTSSPLIGPPQWINSNGPVYILASPGVSGAELERRLDEVIPPLVPGEVREDQGEIRLGLEPLSDLYLHSGRWTSMNQPPANAATVYATAGVAVLLLGIAAINYTNLATARASLRTREVGLRKTVGAKRRQLIVQFLGESILVAAGGLLLALVLTELMAEPFASLIGIRLYFSPWTDPLLLTGAILLTLGVGVVGGAYPALYLSGIRPAAVLRAGKGGVGGAGRLRAALVIVQFACAVGLAAATLIVVQQTRYATTAELGFDKENRLILSGIRHEQVRLQLEPLKDELLRIPGVTGAAASWMVPGGAGAQGREVYLPGTPDGERMNPEVYRVEHGFLDVLGVRMLAGRGFDRARAEDEMRFPDGVEGPQVFSTVLNATAARNLGFASPEEALGQILDFSDDTPVTSRLRVIGVVEDFRPRNARNAIRPTVFVGGDPVYRYNFLTLRLAPGADLDRVLTQVDVVWSRFAPDIPVARSFLDEYIERMYEREKRIAGVLGGFAALTVAIACLGLFALAAFEAERRTKEIGVRKVLGATVLDIVRLLAWRFSRPVLIANLIAWPVTWFLVAEWLGGFAYRIDVTPLPFILAGGGALLIGWITVAGHAARVAARPPVQALRYE
ncbi:ABC transporter permease [Indioceanicola profundi]|uniref:ABC transporter permease n=1 Tax=Indioceanicola profundi TaxID=2220096 RepID=UPI000E6AC455|nr:ABC transporter permease [Indioceanicola profundi]